jgi:hypothetical protein
MSGNGVNRPVGPLRQTHYQGREDGPTSRQEYAMRRTKTVSAAFALAGAIAAAVSIGTIQGLPATAKSPATQATPASSQQSRSAVDGQDSRRVSSRKGTRPGLVADELGKRIFWGYKHGCWRLTLWTADVNRDSLVFVSAHEGYPGYVGDAKLLVYSVAPFDGGVTARVCMDYPSDVPLYLDYHITQP